MKCMVSAEEIARAAVHPPEDTRAYFRGRAGEKFAADLTASSWQSMLFTVDGELYRVPLDLVGAHTKQQVGQLIDSAETTEALLSGLGVTPER